MTKERVLAKKVKTVVLLPKFETSVLTCFIIFIGAEFLRNAPEGKYDAIIVDGSDPIGMFYNTWSYILFMFRGCMESMM